MFDIKKLSLIWFGENTEGTTPASIIKIKTIAQKIPYLIPQAIETLTRIVANTKTDPFVKMRAINEIYGIATSIAAPKPLYSLTRNDYDNIDEAYYSLRYIALHNGLPDSIRKVAIKKLSLKNISTFVPLGVMETLESIVLARGNSDIIKKEALESLINISPDHQEDAKYIFASLYRISRNPKVSLALKADLSAVIFERLNTDNNYPLKQDNLPPLKPSL